MRADLIMNKPIYSSFLSCDKDVEKILRTLFVTSKPYSDVLKKLLLINSKDCLQNNENYKKVIDRYSLGDLIEKGYVRLNPKIARGTFEEMKSYIIISLDNFTPNRGNPEYVDYNINFDVVCYMDAWVLDDFKVRPLMICGYIDGMLKSLTENNKKIIRSQAAPIKLTGIGSYELLGCNEVVLNEDISMYTLSFRGMHFSEDIQQIGSV